MSLVQLHYIRSQCLSHLQTHSLTGLNEASGHGGRGGGGGVHTAKNQKCPPANSRQETEALSPTTWKKPNSASSHKTLERDPSPVEPWDET